MALASVCNHSIYDYGTYGFWGAFLAHGVTVAKDSFNGTKNVKKKAYLWVSHMLLIFHD